MTTDALRDAVLSTLAEIAPEADLSRVRSDVPLREQLDLDSMDMLNFAVGLHAALGVDIPEADYGKLATVDACVAYLKKRRTP